MDSAAKVSEHWARFARQRQAAPQSTQIWNWLDSPIVQQCCIHPRISGEPEVGWFEWVMKSCVPMDATSACTLGCGDGGLERHARFLGFSASFHSFDLSEGALEVARAQAAEQGLAGIEYQQADLNALELPTNSYQVVFASMSLHHVANLEHLYGTVKSALVPGGLLVFNEFVGPRKFQWTDLQLELINRLLAGLPPRLRKDLSRDGREPKADVYRLTVEEMDAIDPSEAVLSDQILPLAHQFFSPVLQRDYGGTILHLLLDRIVGNFHEGRKEDLALLERIFQLESLLIETKVLPSDFTMAVFQKQE